MTEIAIIPKDVIENIQSTQKQIINMMQKLAPSQEELVTVKEAAKIAKLSEQKIRQMFDNGEIAGKRIGKRSLRIFRSSL